MYLCYMDESGTPDLPGNTSHFILVGLSIPVWHWKTCDREIAQLKREHSLGDEEIHCAWMLRRYLEQSKIKNFAMRSCCAYSEHRRHGIDRQRRTTAKLGHTYT